MHTIHWTRERQRWLPNNNCHETDLFCEFENADLVKDDVYMVFGFPYGKSFPNIVQNGAHLAYICMIRCYRDIIYSDEGIIAFIYLF